MKRAVRTIVLVVAVACAFASASTIKTGTGFNPLPLCGGTICK